MTQTLPDSVKPDRIDHQLLHALVIHGRAPFSLLADVIGISEQTVARRYRRLHDAGAVRVLVLPARTAGLEWILRIAVRPGATMKLAAALARRSDVSWVRIVAGGSEIVCSSHPSPTEERDALLLDRLASTNLVTSIVAHAILRMFAGGGVNTWCGFDDPLDPDQTTALRNALAADLGRDATVGDGEAVREARPEDAAIYAALRDDGRSSYAALAAAAGISRDRVARRLDVLLATRQMHVQADLASGLLGFPTTARLWLSVAPAELENAGRLLGALPSTTFVAALTGPANLAASVVCRNETELYSIVTHHIGGIAGVLSAEISPVLRTVKRASAPPREPVDGRE